MTALDYWLFILSWLMIYWIGFNKSFFHAFALASATAFIFIFVMRVLEQ